MKFSSDIFQQPLGGISMLLQLTEQFLQLATVRLVWLLAAYGARIFYLSGSELAFLSNTRILAFPPGNTTSLR
jgi:hypothetical protein